MRRRQEIDLAKWEQKKDSLYEFDCDDEELIQGWVDATSKDLSKPKVFGTTCAMDNMIFMSEMHVQEDKSFTLAVKAMYADDSQETEIFESEAANVESALKAIKVMVISALEKHDKPTHHAEEVEVNLRKYLTENGYIKGREPSNNEDLKLFFRRTLRRLVPNSIGGLVFGGCEQYEEPATRHIVTEVWWGEREDEVSLEIRLPILALRWSAFELEKEIERHSQEKIALLKMEYPGDYEVVCTDATGEKHRLTTGMTYLAERHTDPSMVWVYDKLGVRGEFGMFRFERVDNLKKDENGVSKGTFLGVPTEVLRAKRDDGMPQGLSRVLDKMAEELGR